MGKIKGKKELLFSITKKDFDIQWFSGTGAGGQHRNKHAMCCRMIHPPSGVRTTGQSNAERKSNLQEAFKNMIQHKDFKSWHRIEIARRMGEPTIEEKVDTAMNPDNIKIEGRNPNGKWESM